MKLSLRMILSAAALAAAVLLPAAFLPRGPWLLTAQVVAMAVTFMLVVRRLILQPVRRTAEWIQRLRQGRISEPSAPLPQDLFGPLAREVNGLADSLVEARDAAEKEAKLRQKAESVWTPERLREHVRTKLRNRPLVVISNREPYQHYRQGKETAWMIPPSGLVTALEPILQSCGGLWIAQGTGDADRETVDATDKIRVPPEEPSYTLRRVWVTAEEQKGYYYGFANEGLWPLCHIAHTRPIFRPEDWAAYQAVNERFAQVALEEMQTTEEPYVLVQDYHFALVPQMIKAKRPDARVALFWHIPWPNPESFGICPWRKELLEGMLGADLLGFHIQYHCNNFLDTVDRTLESRIDWARYAVTRQGHATVVSPFPISVPFAPISTSRGAAAPDVPTKEALFQKLGVKSRYLGVGVDRIDYTKGILERFRGLERFFEQNPEFVGELTFVELGAPSRTLISSYKNLSDEMMNESQRINDRFKTKEWKPIIVLQGQHSHKDIEPYYRRADVCVVTSLHDGMNLVAKEFVAARNDEDGVLILSPFTGASWELRDALIANPYDVDQLSKALREALEMPPEERKARMHRLREVIRDRNIYRWGASLISELAQIRIPSTPASLPAADRDSALVTS